MRRIVTMTVTSGHATTLRAASPRPDNLPQSMREVWRDVQALGPIPRETSRSRREDWSAFVGDGDRSGFAGAPQWPSALHDARRASPRTTAPQPLKVEDFELDPEQADPAPYVITIDGEHYVRPRTRAECGTQRPCPWASCRHHLLLEVNRPRGHGRRPKAVSIRLNRPHTKKRTGLSSSAAGELVQRWIADATEWLSFMRDTCSLDVVVAYPDGLVVSRIGQRLGCTKQEVLREMTTAMTRPRLSAALEELR